jgi:hypothetical protein
MTRDNCVRVVWPSITLLSTITMDANQCKAQPVNSTTSRQIVHSEQNIFN